MPEPSRVGKFRSALPPYTGSLIKFTAQVGLSFIVNLGATVFLHEVAGLPEEVAYAAALILVFFMNFFMLRYFVYKSSEGSMRSQFVGFLFSTVGFRFLEYLTFLILCSLLGIYYAVSIVAVSGAGTVVKFFFYRHTVFRQPPGHPP